MRLASAEFDAEVTGSTFGDRLEVNVWRGGLLLVSDLDVTGWGLSWDGTRQVHGQATFTVADPTGELAPWGLSDPLGPGGSRLQVTWLSGLSGARVPLGWWRIRKADPSESWRVITGRTPTATEGPVAYTNVETNPDAETAGAATTVRTNALSNPSIETGITGWQVAGASTLLRVNTDAYAGTWSLQVTTTAAGAGASFQVSQVAPTTVAATAYLAAYVKAPAGATINIRAEEYTPPSTVVGVSTVATFTATGAWQRVNVSRPNIAVGNVVRPAVVMVGVVGAFLIDAVIVEYNGGAGFPYFDGARLAAGDFTYTWSGTANASTSLQRAPAAVGVADFNSTQALRWSSAVHAAGGSRSWALLTGQNNATAGYIWGGITPAVAAGQWVTFQVAVLASVGQRISTSIRTAVGSGAGTVETVATGAWQVVTVSAQAAVAGALVGGQSLTTGTTPTGTQVYWDRALVVVGPTPYTGPYFDGNTPDTSDMHYAWTGAAHASTSTARPMVVTYASTATRVAGGGSVTVQADEESATVVLSRLDAEVVREATCLAEVRRLLSDIGPVVTIGPVVDGPVPSAFVYSDSRIDAVEDLLTSIRCVYRMGPDGSFEVLPAAGTTPVWTVAGGPDGVLVSLTRALSDERVYNAATSSSETAAGQPLVGRAFLQAGALAWGGPYGKVPVFHEAVAQTADGVLADAQTVLTTMSSAGEVDLEVDCLTHPGLQIHDRVHLLAPTLVGDATLAGRVIAMTLAATDGGTPAKSMRLTLRVPAEALETIAWQVRNG